MIRSLAVAALATLVCAPVLAQQDEKPKPSKPMPAPSAEAAQEAEKAAAEKPAKLELGKTIPQPVVLKDIDGNSHDAANYLGQVVVVNFWSTRCPIMQGYEERLKEIHQDFTERGVRFLMINSNAGNGELTDKDLAEDQKPYQEIRGYLKEKELPYTVLVDSDSSVAKMFDAKTTPDIYVFDRAGKLVYRGLIDDDAKGNKADTRKNHLREVLNKALAGDEIEPYATTPYGCTIKWAQEAKEAGENGRERRPGGRGRGRDRGEGRN